MADAFQEQLPMNLSVVTDSQENHLAQYLAEGRLTVPRSGGAVRDREMETLASLSGKTHSAHLPPFGCAERR